MAIYLGPPLPTGSSGLPEDGAGRSCPSEEGLSSYLALLRVGFAQLPSLPRGLVRSYRTFSPLSFRSFDKLRMAEGRFTFLWHFPSSRLARELPGTLPGGARTFLPSGKRKGGHPAS